MMTDMEQASGSLLLLLLVVVVVVVVMVTGPSGVQFGL